eukprot:scpid34723/ scgid7008/ 
MVMISDSESDLEPGRKPSRKTTRKRPASTDNSFAAIQLEMRKEEIAAEERRVLAQQEFQLRIETQREEAEDRRERERRQYEEAKAREQREYDEAKAKENREYEEKKEEQREKRAAGVRQSEKEFNASLLVKLFSK